MGREYQRHFINGTKEIHEQVMDGVVYSVHSLLLVFLCLQVWYAHLTSYKVLKTEEAHTEYTHCQDQPSFISNRELFSSKRNDQEPSQDRPSIRCRARVHSPDGEEFGHYL